MDQQSPQSAQPFHSGDRVRVRDSKKPEYIDQIGAVEGVYQADSGLEVYVKLDNGVRGKFLHHQIEPLDHQMSFDDLLDFSSS